MADAAAVPENEDYLISNELYAFLNKIVTILLPAIAALYASLAQVWDWPNAEGVLATCAALAVFGGILLKFAEKSYDKSDSKYDGSLAVTGIDPDTGHPDLQLTVTVDPATLVGKNTLKLKSVTNELPDAA